MNSFAGMERVALIASLISCVGWHSASANITVIPRDTESKVNDSTYFNCSTDILSKEIHWSHGSKDVYGGGSFYEPYLGRFRIEINNSTGVYNLVIPSVEPQDVGEYFCQDDGGHGRHSPAAKLIVLADEPTCHSNSFQDGNGCELQPDEVQLSCSVTYHGNIPPKLEWRKAGENSLIGKATSVESGNITTYSITLKTDLSMDSQSYVCQTTRSVTSQYKCNSETIRLQYVFSGNATVKIAVDEEVKCSANSSQSCSYKWKWFSGSDSLTVSTDQTLKPTRVGSHRCEATCPIGNTSCVVDVMFAEVYSTPLTEAITGQYMWVLWILVPVIIIIILIIIGVLCWRRRRTNQRPSASAEYETVKPSHSATPQDEAIKDDPSAMPLIAMNAEDSKEAKQNHEEQNKDNKELSLLEGKPEAVGAINREEDQKKRITGVAVLKNELLVASENSPALEVYDVINKCARTGRVPIAEMVNPFDLASCHITECVFISDSKLETKPKEIIRIDANKTVSKRWSTGDDFGNLSVSSDSNIILCVTDKNMLIEYTKDGENIRVINLPGKVHPLHAIKLTNGQFVISHGWKNDLLHQVCNVNKNGEVVKLVKSFGGERGTSLQHLNEPNYLIVDEEGFIVVVDSGNKRALLLDSNLKVKREFLTKYTGVINPVKLCLCEATRNLFVVDSVCVVLIISIK